MAVDPNRLLSDEEVFGTAPAASTARPDMRAYADSIAAIESGGRYDLLGPPTKGDRAYGKYQVMGRNIPSWTQEALGRSLTPEQFLADSAAQEAVFAHHFGKSVDRYGNPNDAASVWFTGRPASEGANRRDVLGTSGAGYVSRFQQELTRRRTGPQVAAAGPGVTSGLLTDEEVFGTPSPTSTKSRASGAFPDPSVTSLGNFGEAQVGLPETEPVAPSVEPTAAPPTEGPGRIARGFVSTLLDQNPKTMASTLEMLAQLSPVGNEKLLAASEYMKGLARLSPKEYETRSKGLKSVIESGRLDDALEFALEGLGKVAGTALPVAGTSVAGAVVGGAAGSVVPVVGTAAGATGGALGGAFIGSLAFNAGDAYDTLVEAGLDKSKAAQYAAYLGPAMAGLDLPLAGQIIGRLGGVNEVKRQMVRNIAHRILAGGGKGVAKESVTEMVQEALPLATASLATDKPFWTPETGWQLAGAGVLGAIGGGAFGGAAGIPRDRASKPPEQSEIDNLADELARRGETPPTPGTSAPLPPEPPVEPPPPPDTVDNLEDIFLEEEDVPFARRPLSTDPNIVAAAVPEATPEVEPSVPPFFSVLDQMAREKLPESATAEQILNTLRGRVKEEELADTGLDSWLLQRRGQKVKKEDILEYLADNFIDVEEVVQSDAPGMGEGQPLAQYKGYITPGPRQLGYKEFLLSIPSRLVPKGQPDFTSPHYRFRNIISSIRSTFRTDATGVDVLHLEEVQSDVHEQGRTEGYLGQDPEKERKRAVLAREWERLEQEWLSLTDTSRAAPVGRELLRRMDEVANLISEGAGYPVPNLPFKKSWSDLAIKRMIRYAADNGIRRITLAPGSEQVRRYARMPEKNKAGLAKFYDQVLPNKMKEQIKRLGGTYGTTKIQVTGARVAEWRVTYPNGVTIITEDRARANQAQRESGARVEPAPPETLDVFYIDIPPDAATQVRGRGLPLYQAVERGDKYNLEVHGDEAVVKNHPLYDAASRAMVAIAEVAKAVGLENKITYHMYVRSGGDAGYTYRNTDVNGRRPIFVNLAENNSILELWSTMAHELGHIFAFERFDNAPAKVKAAITAAYEKWRDEHGLPTSFYSPSVLSRSAISSVMLAGRYGAVRNRNARTRLDQTSAGVRYWGSFDEFMAEKFAQWATTSQYPVTVIDKWFKGVARALIKLHQLAYRKLGMTFRPEPVIAEWFQSALDANINFAQVSQEFLLAMQNKNQKIMDKLTPELEALPDMPEFIGAREALDETFGGRENVPEAMKEAAAHADRFNWRYKWGLSLIQVAKRNWHIKELQAYREDVQKMHIETQRVMSAAHFVLKQLRKLGQAQEGAVYAAMNDLDQMMFRTPQERARNVQRNPTRAEVTVIVQRHGLTSDGIKALSNMRKMFDDFLALNEAVAKEVAQRTFKDPTQLSEALTGITRSFQQMRSRPYFPHMQFGELFVEVRDARGAIVHLESVERSGFRTAKQMQRALFAELNRTKSPGETVRMSRWTEDVQPLVGMPRALLDIMSEKLQLSQAQREQLDQLRFAAAPAASFRHRFQRRKNIAGYSMDFRRAFAKYFFHGAHFLSKARYADILRGHVKALEVTTRARGPDGQFLFPDTDKRIGIVNFLHDHMANIMNPKGDWAALRAFTFVFALGYSPAAALLNMTQLAVGTYPFLGAKFGDARAIAAMTRASKQISTFYKKGTLQGVTDPDLRALEEAIKDGTITEAMAPELAATANGQNMILGIGGNAVQRGWMHFMEKAAFMFEMMEQLNRRVTFRAAWDLALRNPDNPFIEEAVRANPGKLARLTGPTHQGGLGWTEQHARAYIAAKEVTEGTQYVYAPYARPRFMRGKAGTLFIFKTFVQNTLFMLGNYPAVAMRSLLVMAFLGGAMGLPGAEDIKEILKVAGWWLFGKDFDLEKESRKFIVELSDGTIPPDLILHGLARRGMGIPAVLDLMGSTAGMSSVDAAWERFRIGVTDKPHVKAPILDWSKAVGMGTILPVQLGELFGPPNKDQSRAIADQMQRASGAAFGLGFNLYKSLTDMQLEANDPKRWERTIPRAFAGVSKAFRMGFEGGERDRSGAMIVKYDAHDTEQLGELVAQGLGFSNLRLSSAWDRIIATKEANDFLDISRGVLMRQFHQAIRAGDQEVVDKVRGSIRAFNDGLPDHAKGKSITADSLRDSVKARQRAINLKEQGLPLQKKSIGITRHVQELFPEGTMDLRKVPQ